MIIPVLCESFLYNSSGFIYSKAYFKGNDWKWLPYHETGEIVAPFIQVMIKCQH